MTKKLL